MKLLSATAGCHAAAYAGKVFVMYVLHAPPESAPLDSKLLLASPSPLAATALKHEPQSVAVTCCCQHFAGKGAAYLHLTDEQERCFSIVTEQITDV